MKCVQVLCHSSGTSSERGPIRRFVRNPFLYLILLIDCGPMATYWTVASDVVAQRIVLVFADVRLFSNVSSLHSPWIILTMAAVAAAHAHVETIEVAPGVVQPIVETELYVFLASLPGAKSDEFLSRAGGPLQSFDCAFCESCPCIVLQ